MCLPVAMTPSATIGPLEPADVGAAHLGRQVGVLAVGLLDPAPARIARDVEHRREGLSGPGGQHAPADRRRHHLDELGVPRGGGADRLLEGRRVPGQQAVQRLLVDDRRDPQARLLDEVALDLVRAAETSVASRFVAPATRVICPIPQPIRS